MNPSKKRQETTTDTETETESARDWSALERFGERLEVELSTPEGRARLAAFLDQLAP